MVEVVISPDPYLALVGDIHEVSKNYKRFVAISLLLAKHRVVILWMSRAAPKARDWIQDMVFCSE